MRYEIINERKRALNLTNTDLAEKTGITLSTLDKITAGSNQNPKLETLQRIADAIGCSLDDFSDKKRLSIEATNIAIEYEKLDLPGQRTVRAVLDSEIQRVTEAIAQREVADAQDKAKLLTIRTYRTTDRAPRTTLRLFAMPSAAGVPIFDDSGEYEEATYPADIVPHGTDYAVNIMGHSMEPSIPNGATVFVQETTEINNGDVVIVWIDAEGLVCKRARVLGDRLMRLESDNAQYPGIEGADLRNARIYGRVLGHTANNKPEEPAAPEPAPQSVGERLRAARLTRGYSPEDVARSLSIKTGAFVVGAFVTAWEDGRQQLPRQYIQALANILEIDLEGLK